MQFQTFFQCAHLAGVNYFFRRIASLDLLPGMHHCLTAIVTEGDGRQTALLSTVDPIEDEKCRHMMN